MLWGERGSKYLPPPPAASRNAFPPPFSRHSSSDATWLIEKGEFCLQTSDWWGEKNWSANYTTFVLSTSNPLSFIYFSRIESRFPINCLEDFRSIPFLPIPSELITAASRSDSRSIPTASTTYHRVKNISQKINIVLWLAEKRAKSGRGRGGV